MQKGNTAESDWKFRRVDTSSFPRFSQNVLAGFNYWVAAWSGWNENATEYSVAQSEPSRCFVKEKDLARFRAMVLFSNSRNKGFFRRETVVFGGKRRVDEKDSAKRQARARALIISDIFATSNPLKLPRNPVPGLQRWTKSHQRYLLSLRSPYADTKELKDLYAEDYTRNIFQLNGKR